MKNELKINDSRLRLVKLEKSEAGIVKFDKEKLKYQFLLQVGNESDECIGGPWSVKRVDGYRGAISVPRSNFYNPYREVWCLEKAPLRYNPGEETYTTEERKLMMCFLGATVGNHFFDTAEALAQAIGDDKVVRGFYGMYGKEGIKNYMKFLADQISDDSWEPQPFTGIITKGYERNKYSVQKLLQELIEAKAEILVDPDLVGEYKRIGPKTVDNFIESQDKSRWMRVEGVLGNKKRANISVTFYSPVIIDIPENSVGVPKGPMECIRKTSLCIIRDGFLNMKYLGIRGITPKEIGKLKRLGLVSGELLGKGEYVINLTKIPVISKSWIREVSSNWLARLEVKYELAKITEEYLETVYGFSEEKEKAKKSEKEIFLETLGIHDGNYYIPYNGAVKKTVSKEEEYKTVELVTEISGLPKKKRDRTGEYSLYHDQKTRGFCGKVLREYFDMIGIDSIASLEYLKKVKGEKKKLEIELRDRKFQIIMGKKATFSDTREYIDSGTPKKVEIVPGVMVGVTWKFEEKIIRV